MRCGAYDEHRAFGRQRWYWLAVDLLRPLDHSSSPIMRMWTQSCGREGTMVKMLLVCVRYHFTPGSTGREEVRMELVCLVAGGRARKQTNQGLVNSGFGAGRLGKRYICPRCLPPQPLQHHNPVFMTSTSNFTTVNSFEIFRLYCLQHPSECGLSHDQVWPGAPPTSSRMSPLPWPGT